MSMWLKRLAAAGAILLALALPAVAQVKISALPDASASTAGVFPVVQAGATNKATISADGIDLVGKTNAQIRTQLALTVGTDVQAWDADLDSWGAITRASGYDTFTATPSCANLRALLTDESGTGTCYFAGGNAGTPSAIVLTNATGLPLTGLASQSADTVVLNASGSSAAPTAVAMPTSGTNGCAGASNALTYNTSTHALGCNSISGTGAAGSNTHVQYNSSGSFAANSGFVYDGTSKIGLGVAGASVGSIDFKNATSGAVNVHPPTGALGSADITLPIGTRTLATLDGTETFSNKTLVAPALGTPASGTLTNATGLPISGLVASTSTAIGVGSVELGHASDTTLSRASAGQLAVEGVNVLMSGGALGTPSSGTLTNATGLPVAGITSSTSTPLGVGSLEVGNASDTTISRSAAGVIQVESVPLYSNIPVNSQSAAYTTVLGDAQKFILHPTADNNARTFTIDSNANVAYPIGTTITFINQINTVTISITSDTLTLAGAGTTGSRTLAANGMATAVKVSSTLWFISGMGLT